MGLLLCMMKIFFFTGRYVILDSNLCVLKGSIHLRKKGVLTCTFIKKIRYLPYMVPGK